MLEVQAHLTCLPGRVAGGGIDDLVEDRAVLGRAVEDERDVEGGQGERARRGAAVRGRQGPSSFSLESPSAALPGAPSRTPPSPITRSRGT